MSVLNGEDEANVTPQGFSINQFDSSFLTNQGFPRLVNNLTCGIKTDGPARKPSGPDNSDPLVFVSPLPGRGSGSVTPGRRPLPGHPRSHLRAALQAHLRQEGGDVVLHGLFRNAQLFADFTVRQAIANQV